jgi:hypothetical protein
VFFENKYDLKRRKEDLERLKLKARYQTLILDVVSNFSALVAAADDSTMDILSLFEVFKYFSKFKNISQQLTLVTSRLLSLVFSKSEKIENAVIKFFQSKFFDEK